MIRKIEKKEIRNRIHRRIRRIQSPHANPSRALTTETTSAAPMVIQNAARVFSAT